MRAGLLIAAAGVGARLGRSAPKALVSLAGQPLLLRTLHRFEPLGLLDGAIVLYPEGHRDAFARAVEGAFPRRRISFIEGGAERQESVERGLSALPPETQIVVIHDAARPFITPDAVQRSIEAAAECGAATVAIPSVDTILVGDAEAFLAETPDRRFLWQCQTPQTFRVEVIREAHRRAAAEHYVGTDDASLVRRMGGRVRLVHGTPMNFKVTNPEDLTMAELIVRERLA